MRLLLVEDDEHLGRAVRTGLAQQGHSIDWVRDGVAAELAARGGHYEAVLLDIGLPRRDGLQVLRNLRQSGCAAAVLIITARDEIADRVHGLDNGADDFIVKPFDLDELGARIRAVVRRAAGRADPVLVHADLRVDPAARQVLRGDKAVAVTEREFALLVHLLEKSGRVCTREQLQESLYDWGSDIESNAIEVHVHNLRRKLGRDLIRTVHGRGYVIDPAIQATEAP